MNKITLLLVLLFLILNLQSQDSIPKTIVSEFPKVEEKKAHWSDKITIRGYTQVRNNRLFESNSDLVSEQGDKSIGNKQGFFIRRMRIIFFGQLSDNVYFYIQPDFASSASSTSLHFGQLRDAYFDVSLDKKHEFRFRIGQSKVPYGFENRLQAQLNF